MTYVVLSALEKATAFEACLKSSHAFARKRLW